HRSAGMVHGRSHISEPDEITEILDGGIAAAAFQVAHKGRTVNRGENRMRSADVDAALRIARMLGELPGSSAHQLAAQTTRKIDALAADIGARSSPEAQSFRIAAIFDPDFLHQLVCIGL